jgi:EmrB/QacA subfamily drug resistance transporter
MIVEKLPCDEGVMSAKSNVALCEPSSERWILAATVLGSSLAFIDGTVVNVALPALQEAFQTTATDLQWVVVAYALFLSALMLVGGALGDHYGRKRVFGLGVLIFGLSSAWCGMSGSVTQLIMARALQGAGGALLVPGSLAIIRASFSEERRGQAIGTWSGFTGITTAFGPVLGGWLVEHVSWRWVFFINIPVAVIVLALLARHVPESRDTEIEAGLDWIGAALAVIGLGVLVYGLIAAGDAGLQSPRVIALIVLGIVVLGAFLYWESRVANPMLPPVLFQSRVFSVTNALTLLLYAALGGASYFVPFNLIQVQGYSPTAAGSALLPMIFLMFILSRWAGGLVQRRGSKLPLVVGPFIAALGFVLFALPGVGGSYWTTFFPAILVLGLGMSVSIAPLTTTVMGAVDERHAGLASGVNNAVSRVASLLSIAVLTIILVQQFGNGVERRVQSAPISVSARQAVLDQRTSLAGARVPDDIDPAEATVLRTIIQESFVDAFRTAMLLASGLAALGGLTVLVLIDSKTPSARPKTF